MRRLRADRRAQTAGWLLVFAGLAFGLRVGISYDAVFGHDFVRFVEHDAWYHMRLVDATVRHFPYRIWFDPYLVHPGGEPVNAGPFFDWVIGGAALLIGLGSPSSHLVDVVGAYVPAVFGALFGVPVYVLGRELFSRRAGLWAAFIVAILPGQILLRSMLGYTDHHCAETLLSTLTLMWIVLALDPSRPVRRRFWLSAGGGVTLGCYLLTWGGGSVFVLIVVASAAASLVIQRAREDSADRLPLILAPAFVIAAMMVAPWIATRPYFGYDIAALLGGLALLVALHAWGVATSWYRHAQLVYVMGLAAAIGLCLSLAYISLDGWSGLAREVGRISPWRPAGYVREATPLLKSPDRFPLPLWNDFVTGLFLAILGLVWYLVRPRAIISTRGMLLFLWTGILLVATLGQVRFAYYLAVNVALLSGFACDEMLRSIEGSAHRWRGLARMATGAALLLIVTVPAGARIRNQWGSEYSLSDDWYDALQWLQSNSPEPFDVGDAYYRTDLESLDRAATRNSYGVLAWWDYGYWITRVAHRAPNTNPKQTQVHEVASFLVAESPDEAAKVLDALDSRYVIVDALLQFEVVDEGTARGGFFAGVAFSAGRKPSDYCQQFELPGDESQVLQQTYCFPRYYQTMAVRLYAFGGRAITPRSVTAISWTDQDRRGRHVKRLVSQMTFGTFDEASRFIAAQPSEHWQIASADPLVSCVPLDALTGFEAVFQSLGHQRTKSGAQGPSAVQIYKYLPATHPPVASAAVPAASSEQRH